MKEKLNNALNDIDQRYIEEAARAGHTRSRAPKILAASLGTAAVAAAVIAVCVLAGHDPDPGVDLIQPSNSAADTLTREDIPATSDSAVNSTPGAVTSEEAASSEAENDQDESDMGSIISEEPDGIDIESICREGSTYDAARAQELIRSSVMPLPDDSMIITSENGYDEWTGRVHSGVDLSNGEPAEVYAYQSGTVLRAADGWNGGMGRYIVIDHGYGLVTVYGHLGEINVTEGQQVERGEVIGESGTTGYSTSVHLHFEIRENGIISTAMGGFTRHTHQHRWVREGAKVYSSIAGEVWLVGEVPDMGKIVVIHGEDDKLIMYSHCSEVVVLPGDEISAGDRVAIAGKPEGSDMTVIAEEEITSNDLSYYSTQAADGQFQQTEMDFLWPVGGEDGGVITELMYGYGGNYAHKGIDITAPKGTEVFAAESGTVIKAEFYSGYGNCVMIDHENGLVTLYGHLNEINVTEGQQVIAGEQIGSVGTTGETSDPNLHFEIRKDGENVNPVPYLPWHKVEIGTTTD